MDLFDALVRLDAAGWQTTAPRPDRAEHAPTATLGRLLRRTASLAPPDGSPPYDFTGEPGPGFAAGVPMLRLRSAADGETWLAVHDGRTSVWRVGAGGPVLLARRLSDWLGDLVAGTTREALGEPCRALWDLGLEGEGWGWSLEGLQVPARLDPESLPEELRAAPLAFDGRVLWVGERIGVPGDAGSARRGPALDARATAPASSAVDELFGEGEGRPRPRTALVVSLLASGLALTVLGMACIAAPGGILVLLAWMYVEKDVERLESGYLPEEDRVAVERARGFTYAGLLIVVLLFAIQGFLLCNGAYDALLDEIYLPAWQSLIRSLLGVPDPAPATP